MQSAFERIAANAGSMAPSFTPMAHDLGRISDAARRMERRANQAIDAISGASYKAEPYIQELLEKHREMVASLEEIRLELGRLKGTLAHGPSSADAVNEAERKREIQTGIQRLRDRLDAISSQH